MMEILDKLVPRRLRKYNRSSRLRTVTCQKVGVTSELAASHQGKYFLWHLVSSVSDQAHVTVTYELTCVLEIPFFLKTHLASGQKFMQKTGHSMSFQRANAGFFNEQVPIHKCRFPKASSLEEHCPVFIQKWWILVRGKAAQGF